MGFPDEILYKNIKSSAFLLPSIRQLAEARSSPHGSPTADGKRVGSDASLSDQEMENGADEIASLSRRILDLTDDEVEPDTQPTGGDHNGLRLNGMDGQAAGFRVGDP